MHTAQCDNTAQQKGAGNKYDAQASMNMMHTAQGKQTNMMHKRAAVITKNQCQHCLDLVTKVLKFLNTDKCHNIVCTLFYG